MLTNIAPIIGGILGESLGWRSTQWAIAIYGLAAWLMLFFVLPETLKKQRDFVEEAAQQAMDSTRPPLTRTSTRQSVQVTSKKYVKLARMLLLDPLRVLAYLRFPAVLLTVYYSAITFGSLYVLNVSVQYTFGRSPYNFATIIVGLLYIPNSLGYIISSLLGGRWMDWIMAREAKKRRKGDEPLVLLPEDRMRENAWLGALLYPAALIWYGWTAEKGVFWLVPVRQEIRTLPLE